MNLKRELIALAIRFAAENTNLVRKPDSLECFITDIFSGETYDRRMARNIDETASAAIGAAKRIRTDRQFKSIIKQF